MRVSFRPGSGAHRSVVTPIAFFFVLMLGGAVSGCTADHSGTAPDAAVAPSHTPGTHAAATGSPVPSREAVSAMWEARPAFVLDAPDRTQAAYAFAISRPDILRWLPCYCGCGAIGHASNYDCFVKATQGAPIVFEEHGSYCEVCVDIAHMAKDMLARGNSLIQIRAAVDSSFGGLAPGTPTELPPA